MFIINVIAVVALFAIVNGFCDAIVNAVNYRNHLIEEGFEVV